MVGLGIVDELYKGYKSRSLMKGRANLLISRSDLDNRIRDLEMKVKRRETKIDELKQQLCRI